MSYAREAGKRYASRAGGYLRAGPGGINFEKVLTYAALGGVAFVVYKLYQSLQGPKKAYDDATDALAQAIVGDPMQLADGITFILPDGSHVPANMTVSLTGSTFTYNGKKYKLVAASPPGSGFYTAKLA